MISNNNNNNNNHFISLDTQNMIQQKIINLNKLGKLPSIYYKFYIHNNITKHPLWGLFLSLVFKGGIEGQLCEERGDYTEMPIG